MSQAKQVTEPIAERKRPLHNVFEEKITVHPLVPLARAASILRTDPILLKERLVSGQIKGEQRPDSDPSSQKNSWFIYASEFNRLLNDQLARYENRISTEGLDQFFEAKTTTNKNFSQTSTEHKVADQLFSKPQETEQQSNNSKSRDSATDQPEPIQSSDGEVVADADVQVNFSVNQSDDVIHIKIDDPKDRDQDAEIGHESAMQLISELASKLEASTYRNGYLEALLEAQAEQIKLLPDLQAQASKTALLEAELQLLRQQSSAKKSWLGSFASWFSGKA